MRVPKPGEKEKRNKSQTVRLVDGAHFYRFHKIISSTCYTSGNEEEIELGGSLEGVMGSDLDLLGRGAGLERVGHKDDLDVQLVELVTKDTHGTHDIEKIEVVKDEGAQLERGDACRDLGKRTMDGVGTFSGRHSFSLIA